MNGIAKATVDRGDNDAYNNNSLIFILIGFLIHFQSSDLYFRFVDMYFCSNKLSLWRAKFDNFLSILQIVSQRKIEDIRSNDVFKFIICTCSGWKSKQ